MSRAQARAPPPRPHAPAPSSRVRALRSASRGQRRLGCTRWHGIAPRRPQLKQMARQFQTDEKEWKIRLKRAQQELDENAAPRLHQWNKKQLQDAAVHYHLIDITRQPPRPVLLLASLTAARAGPCRTGHSFIAAATTCCCRTSRSLVRSCGATLTETI